MLGMSENPQNTPVTSHQHVTSYRHSLLTCIPFFITTSKNTIYRLPLTTARHYHAHDPHWTLDYTMTYQTNLKHDGTQQPQNTNWPSQKSYETTTNYRWEKYMTFTWHSLMTWYKKLIITLDLPNNWTWRQIKRQLTNLLGTDKEQITPDTDMTTEEMTEAQTQQRREEIWQKHKIKGQK